MSTIKVDNIQTTTGNDIFTSDANGNITFAGDLTINGTLTAGNLGESSGYTFPVNNSITFESDRDGRMGMTLGQARTKLADQYGFATWGNDTSLFDVAGGVMFWRVPESGTYRLDAYGSEAGTTTASGDGRGIRGFIELTSGVVLRILCGQRGVSSGNYSGGGGASSVALVCLGGGFKPLLIGGAGCGTSNNDNSNKAIKDARYNATDFQGVNTPEPGRGSLYQNSYGSDLTSYWYGGGGAAWSIDGEEGTIGYWPHSLARPQNRGIALTNHLPKGGWSEAGYHGGFGGGGSTGRDGGSGGAGSGWRGGDAMYCTTSATSTDGEGGGTCYYDVDLITNISDLGAWAARGKFVITRTA
jgi:hypothetical protein